MRPVLLSLLFILIYVCPSDAQGVAPGCYCIDGQLQTITSTDNISSIVAGRQFSDQPCQTAFGQPDGTNCQACVCTDDFNDGGFFQVQNKELFTGTASTGFQFSSCEDILEPDETLLFCGPCPTDQLSINCGDFLPPDSTPGDMMDDATAIPTLGEWSLIILCLGLLTVSIVWMRSLHFSRYEA